MILLSFVEAVFNKGFDLGEGFEFVGAGDAEVEFGAFGGAEHHDAHDAFAVDGFTVTGELRFSGEAAGEVDQLDGGSGMEAQFIDDGDFFAEH